jgi:transketolase C-terminal domain/subunit
VQRSLSLPAGAFVPAGGRFELLARYGLDPEGIVQAVVKS